MDIREYLPIHAVQVTERQRTGRAVLRIDGLVARPVELTVADLARLPRSVLDEPFVCEEGWSVPGTCWAGVRLSDVLALAEPLSTAAFVRAGSGQWVVPVPLQQAATALICDELNGEALTVEHGAPWRLVLAGGACYTNVKWLSRLELTAQSGEDAAQRIARTRLERAGTGIADRGSQG